MGEGSITSLDFRVILYGLGRALLWIVVIASCWSMSQYFHRFYFAARTELGLEKQRNRRKKTEQAEV